MYKLVNLMSCVTQTVKSTVLNIENTNIKQHLYENSGLSNDLPDCRKSVNMRIF